MKNLKRLYSGAVILLLIFYNVMVVFADTESDWGQNVKNWILTQASALAIAAVVIIMVPLIFKKAWSALIGTIFASAVGLFFINKPSTLEAIGKAIYNIVFNKS